MKFFLDSANLKEIQEATLYGLIEGVTTNPSLAAKEGQPFRDLIKEICRVVQGPVSAEVVSTDAAGMVKEGRELAKLDDHVVVKIPIIMEGLKAIRTRSSEGIRINTTLIFSA